MLDDRQPATEVRRAAESIAQSGLDLYYWIEVGRCPAIADEHPEWMASLGLHDDWRSRFPHAPKAAAHEVIKAWPWTPIGYREVFFAQLARIERLLAVVEPGYRGVLLNDLQGGPASCGCGNLQCRWALDYQVPATAERMPGDDVPARFVEAVSRLAPGRQVIPLWTTECLEADLPGGETRLCGDVPCAHGRCPVEFEKQWKGLVGRHRGPVGLLALQTVFGRAPGATTDWSEQYLAQVRAASAGANTPLWLVIEGGGDPNQDARARRSARVPSPAALVVAQTKIDQSFEPRLVAFRAADPPAPLRSSVDD